jgi:hypothetical protein
VKTTSISAATKAAPAETNYVFCLDSLNCFARFDSVEDAVTAGYDNSFSSAEELGEIVGDGNARIVAIWNAQPGVQPVTRFMTRAAGLSRIWNHLETMWAKAPRPEIGVEESTLDVRTTRELPPDKPAKPTGVVKARPVAESTRATVFGFPVTQAIAWMGRQGFKFSEAVAVLTSLEIPAGTDSTVRTYLTKGRPGTKKAAAFDAAQAARIIAARPASDPAVSVTGEGSVGNE